MARINSPHIHRGALLPDMMHDMIFALLPATVMGILVFGLNALLLVACSVGAAVGSEFAFEYFENKRRIKKGLPTRSYTISDCTAAVTGLIIGLCFSSATPFYVAIIASAFAIVVIKLLFGGNGKHIFNPVAFSMLFVSIIFKARMSIYYYDNNLSVNPLRELYISGNAKVASMFNDYGFDVFDLFLGTCPGAIGMACCVGAIFGAVYLIARKVISFRVPVTFMLTVAVFYTIVSIFTRGAIDGQYLMAQLFSGGVIFGAVFVATDFSTSPATPSGKVLYGFLIAILTCIFRTAGLSEINIWLAIVICNLLVYPIEMITMPRAIGRRRHNYRIIKDGSLIIKKAIGERIDIKKHTPKMDNEDDDIEFLD